MRALLGDLCRPPWLCCWSGPERGAPSSQVNRHKGLYTLLGFLGSWCWDFLPPSTRGRTELPNPYLKHLLRPPSFCWPLPRVRPVPSNWPVWASLVHAPKEFGLEDLNERHGVKRRGRLSSRCVGVQRVRFSPPRGPWEEESGRARGAESLSKKKDLREHREARLIST